VEKFHWLTEPYANEGLREEIIGLVGHLEDIRVSELTAALSRAEQTARYPSDGSWARRFGHIDASGAAA
jgi:2-methylcitrate dehydratase